MNKKVISYLIVFLLGGLIFGSIGTVFALTYKASDITYSPTDNTWNVTTVGQAINDLALSKTSDNYSANEQVVGTWFGKPLYQKTITGTTPNTTGSDISIYNDSDIETLNILYCRMTRNDNKFWYTGCQSGSYNIATANNYKTITFWTSDNKFTSQPFAMTFQYTKTTDIATN